MTTLMLIGRSQWVIDAAQRELTSPQRTVYGAITMAELESVLTENRIDHAFVGPGLDLDLRMDLIRPRAASQPVQRTARPLGGVAFACLCM